MIELKNLNKSFDQNHVLKNVSATISNGTIFGLIGINGAGKSTLLRLISGILSPENGDILIDNISLFENDFVRKDIFYLSDYPPYSPHMTFEDIAHLYAIFYPFNYETFEKILNIFGVQRHTPLSSFSKGMKRQGMIAVAFSTQAKYLLLDEVFDGLDPVARLKFKKLIIEHQKEDQIIILTSHSLRELEDICDSFGMIDQGCFKKYCDLSTELNQIIKHQIILTHINMLKLNEGHPPYYIFEQEGRVVRLVCEKSYDVYSYISKSEVLVIDTSSISFEEYFLVLQEGEKK